MVMRPPILLALSVAALLAALGCASILSIPDRTLKWCDHQATVHAFCEDFDQADAGAGLDPPVVAPGAAIAFVPSEDTPPTALDTQTVALPGPDASAVAAMGKRFEDRPFDHVVVEADVRFVQANFLTQDGLTTGVGFLLLADIPSFCIGLVAAPSASNLPNAIDIGVLYVPNSSNCVTVGNLPMPDAGIDPDAGGSLTIFTNTVLKAWTHFRLDAKRASDGSGTVNAYGGAGAGIAPPIPPGSLAHGFPLVGLATTVTGPAGPFEIQFDNVTIDFPRD
jgi:hypothetical protein